MKKNDYILIVVLVFASGILLFLFNLNKNNDSNIVLVKRNDTVLEYKLDEDRIINLEPYMKIQIKNKKVKVIETSCRNKICYRHRYISKTNEQIVCIPNKIVIEIKGGDLKYDAISK